MIKWVLTFLWSILYSNEFYNLFKLPYIILDETYINNDSWKKVNKYLNDHSLSNLAYYVSDRMFRRHLPRTQFTWLNKCLFYVYNPSSAMPFSRDKNKEYSDDIFLYKIFGTKQNMEKAVKDLYDICKLEPNNNQLELHFIAGNEDRSGISTRTNYINKNEIKDLTQVYSPHKKFIFEKVQNFFKEESRKQYNDKGIFYSEGMLLYGPPGTGKTSLIISIAKELNRPLYVVSLRSDSLTDNDIRNIFSKEGLFVVEDVDPTHLGREPKKVGEKRYGFSYETLLNVLDGSMAIPGKFIFYTSNHPDQLPKEMFRPGRVSHKKEIGFIQEKEFYEMWENFYPIESLDVAKQAWGYLKDVKELTPARLQVLFQQYMDDANMFLENITMIQEIL